MSTRHGLTTLAVAAALAAAGCGGSDDAIEGTETNPEGQSPSLVDPAGNDNQPSESTPTPAPGEG